MQGCVFSAPDSKNLQSYPNAPGVMMRRYASFVTPVRQTAFQFVLLLTILLSFSVPALAGPVATSTVLTTSTKTVNSRSITVLSAIVTNPNTAMQGLVRFYDGAALIEQG